MFVVVSTPDLQVGDIVHTHGMRCLIETELTESRSHPPGCFYVAARVLNRDDVPSSHVPRSWTAQEDGVHRWTIQGNRLAGWHVERGE